MSMFMRKNINGLPRIQMQRNLVGSQKHELSDSISKPQAPTTLARLIAKRNWSEVENVLSSTPTESIVIDEKGLITEDNVLHLACRFQAPLHIVEMISTRYPGSLRKPDPTGRFAIHLAAKYSAPPDVMQYLIEENQTAAGIQDDVGKTPIHYVGEFYVQHHDPNATIKEVNENMIFVVRLLRMAAPMSFNLEDNDGCNAIELAIESDTDIKIIKSMQRAARDDWRELKAKEGKKHEERAENLLRVASERRMNVYKDVLSSSFLGQCRTIVSEDDSQSQSESSNPRSFAAKTA
mmetsp:Transcript_4151/g.8215  ORF Transcript_4151/g.8215 Transcript_4151/m.8215 type:complete len:293 (-) Transcript_4151:104-982(-)